MINFPQATLMYRRLPKAVFYKHLTLTKPLRDKFVSDVDHIMVKNTMTKDNLNFSMESEI